MPLRRLLVATLLLAVAGPAAADPTALAAARELYGQRQDAAALAAYQKIAAADPRNAEAQHYLGLLAMRRDEPETAVKFLEQAAALAPTASEYQRRLGDAYGRSAQKAGTLSKLGWARKSRAAYAKAVELDPTNLDARFSLLGYYQNAPGIAGGGMDKAYAEAEEIRKLDPARGRLALAQLYVSEKKHAEAFGLFEETLRSDPDNYAALYQVGRLAAITGERLDTGTTALRRCLALPVPEGQPSHAAAHWRLGGIAEKRGDPAAAREAYTASLAADPNFRSAQDALAKLKP